MTFEGKPEPWHVSPPLPQAQIHLPLLRFDWYIIPPSSAMFRREVVEAVGGFRDPWGPTISTSTAGRTLLHGLLLSGTGCDVLPPLQHE